jgi:hypothetical protein
LTRIWDLSLSELSGVEVSALFGVSPHWEP